MFPAWKKKSFHLQAAKEKQTASVRRFVYRKCCFSPLVIQLVWYILKQLFPSVSVNVVDFTEPLAAR